MVKEGDGKEFGKEADPRKTTAQEENKEESLFFEEIEMEELVIDGICGVY